MPLDAVLPAFLIALLGYFAGKRLNLDKQMLSRVCLYILVPALTFNSLAASKVDLAVAWRLALAVVAFPFAQVLLFAALFKLLRWEPGIARSMLLPAVFTNAGNYGLPVCLFAFGQQGMDLGVVFMVTQTVMLYTVGAFIAASSQMNARTAMRQVLKMPAVYAAAAGVLVRALEVPVPDVVGRPVALLGQAAVPVLLLVLGMQLTGNGETRDSWKEPGVVVFLRLVVAPALAGLMGMAVGLNGLAWKILVLQGAMPPPVNATILAQEFNAHPGAVSKATMGGTLASVLTLSLWIMFLRGI